MVAAVLQACAYIRETGYFNKAVDYYANKYEVDRKELEKNIRARQAAGQKGKKSVSTGKRFKWFLVCETKFIEADGETYYQYPQVLKGLSPESVVNRFTDADWKRTVRADYGGSYAPSYSHEAIAEFGSKEEADAALSEWESYVQRHEEEKKKASIERMVET